MIRENRRLTHFFPRKNRERIRRILINLRIFIDFFFCFLSKLSNDCKRMTENCDSKQKTIRINSQNESKYVERKKNEEKEKVPWNWYSFACCYHTVADFVVFLVIRGKKGEKFIHEFFHARISGTRNRKIMKSKNRNRLFHYQAEPGAARELKVCSFAR